MQYLHLRKGIMVLTSLLICLSTFSMLSTLVAGQIPGDINGDCVIDMDDVLLVANRYNSRVGDGDWSTEADIIADGRINIFDVVSVALRFGWHCPVAIFTESAHTTQIGTPIEFNPADSYDADGTIMLYEWDWESDGLYDHNTSTAEVVTHTYMEPGTYNVTLRVTDDKGIVGTATDTKTITSLGIIPEVPFGTIAASIAMLVALAAFIARPRMSKGQRPIEP